MRTFMLIIALVAMIVVTGCSGLQAKSATRLSMINDMGMMQARALTVPAKASDLAENAKRFEYYRLTATTNLFKFYFGPSTILCTGEMQNELGDARTLSATYAAEALDANDPSSPARMQYRLGEESKWMTGFLLMREGR